MCHVSRTLGGQKSRTERFGDAKNLFPMPGIEPEFVRFAAISMVTIPTELSLLVYFVKRYAFCISPFVLNVFEQRNGNLIASSNADLRSSGMLRRVDWQLVADVSVQPIGPSSRVKLSNLGCLAD